jgi:predicted RNA-binding protein with PUA-like domain
MPNAWLVKSEPHVYSLDDLARDGQTPWTGVRNYQARNTMRDAMAPDDPVLFYHSSAAVVGIVGLARVAGAPYPDPTQFDPSSPYHDPTSTPESPRWMLVDMRFDRAFPRCITLGELKADPALAGMPLLQRGQRLSVQPVTQDQLNHILALAARPEPT